MNVRGIRALEGPNVWHHRPVLVTLLDLGAFDDTDSTMVSGFVDKLLAQVPGLAEHRCSPRRAGGFVERLRRGTYPAHIVEHVAIELSEAAGIGVTFGKTVAAPEPRCQLVVVRYIARRAMERLLRLSVDVVHALLEGLTFPLEDGLAEARSLAAEEKLGPTSQALVDAAVARGIPWSRVGDESLIRLGYGRHRRFVQTAVAGTTSAIAVDIAADKHLTKALLSQAGVPVPHGAVVRTLEAAHDTFREVGAPAVVKPLDGNHGRGVTLDVRSVEQLDAAFARAQEHGSSVIVEQQMVGDDYRVLVIDGKLVAAALRVPAHVVGDGTHTIAQLIELANADPRRGEGHSRVLTRIELDDAARAWLARRQLSEQSVPAAGTRVLLRQTANLSTGGVAKDVTSAVHPSVRTLCERAARAVGLDIAGIDLVAESVIRAPSTWTRGGVVEVNAGPGLRMHLSPGEGAPQDVAGPILDLMYPPGTPSRIPIFSITGTNGKTTATRMVRSILARTGVTVGMTTTDGIWIGADLIDPGDTTGPASARTVLSDPTVDVAILETARGGLVRRGLGYDWADVGVITNVQPDHLGQDGIGSLEDILRIKSLVAERVRPGGTVVLNADDPLLMSWAADHPRRLEGRQLALFGLGPSSVLAQHVARGGRAFVLDGAWLMELRGNTRTRITPVGDVPVTLNGAARFQIANALAAAAIARAHGVAVERCALGLRLFHNAQQRRPRGALYRVGPGFALVDYGHNPGAIAAIQAMLMNWRERPASAVIGLPGDRTDALLAESAHLAARTFRRLVIRDEADLRGRAPGEVPRLICEAARRANPAVGCTIVPDEREAVRHALSRMTAGEILVVFWEDHEVVGTVLEAAGATPVNQVPKLKRDESDLGEEGLVWRPMQP